MKWRTLILSFKEGLKGIRRNVMFSIASISVIAASIFIFGLFFFLTTNLRYMIHSAESKVGISVFFVDGLADEEKTELGNRIKNIPEVSNLHYVSSEEAWEKYKANSLKPELIETFGDDNPLADSDSYTVYVKQIEKQSKVVSLIKTMKGVRKVNSNGKTSNVFVSVNNIVSVISVSIFGILLAISFFLISTTVSMGISVRKEEIRVMRLIGATDFFIEAPFIIEGMMIGMIGSLLPLGILYFAYDKVTGAISEKLNSLTKVFVFLDTATEFKFLVPLSLAIGMGIGFIGSYFTVRRHSNV